MTGGIDFRHPLILDKITLPLLSYKLQKLTLQYIKQEESIPTPIIILQTCHVKVT